MQNVNLNFILTANPASSKTKDLFIKWSSRFKRPKLKMDAIWSMNVTLLTLLDARWNVDNRQDIEEPLLFYRPAVLLEIVDRKF